MPTWLLGKTGYAFFDNSTLIHLSFWVSFGSMPYYLGWPFKKAVLACLFLALLWEVFEGLVAPRFPDIWKHPESWWNAWISDPLTCIVGVFIVYMILRYWTVP